MRDKIKVAIIIPSLQVGGAEYMTVQLFNNLNREKYDVYLLVMSKKFNSNIEDGLNKNYEDKVFYFNKEKGLKLKNIYEVYKFLRKIKPNIIHTHLSGITYALIYALFHKVKILHTIHNRPIYEIPPLLRKVVKYLYKFEKAIPVAISNSILSETMRFYNIGEKNIELIYNPVNVSNFDIVDTKKSNGELTFVSVGRLVPHKNQSAIIEAFAFVAKEYKNIRLMIVGDGETRAELEEKMNKLKLNKIVKFTGNVSNVNYYLCKSDLFVLSSHFEGLPLSILEAMAAGLPIIATDVGGVPDIVTDNGILVDDNNINQLVDAMKKLITDNDLRLKMGEASRKNVAKYDIKEISREYQNLYDKYSI